MRLGAFTANIVVDGEVLEEYDVVSESPTKAICWVASEEGKLFQVQWKCHEDPRVAAVLGQVYADGLSCARKITRPSLLGVGNACIFSHFIDATTKRDLMFARIELSDDDSLLNKEISKNLGEISLVITRGEITLKKRRLANGVDVFVPGQNEKLHEKSKKATVHRVGFGPEKAREHHPYKPRLIHDGQPKMIFVFKYQPLSVLQANGIAPRPAPTDSRENGRGETPDRPPASEDIKPAQLNDRIQNLENELKRLRKLQGDSYTEDWKPKRIKTEDSEKRGRLFAPGEIIDLT